jgi:hypothetical protein
MLYRGPSQPLPSLTVTNNQGWQTQRYDLLGTDIEWTLLGAEDPLVKPTGTSLSDLVIEGIYFEPVLPVRWRPASVAGVMVPETWSWTINSSNGGVTLSQTSTSRAPEVQYIDGVPTLVQRIDTTMNFSGNASGTLTITHWEEVGVNTRARDHFKGTVTVLDVRNVFDTSVVMGGLWPLPRLGG